MALTPSGQQTIQVLKWLGLALLGGFLSPFARRLLATDLWGPFIAWLQGRPIMKKDITGHLVIINWDHRGRDIVRHLSAAHVAAEHVIVVVAPTLVDFTEDKLPGGNHWSCWRCDTGPMPRERACSFRTFGHYSLRLEAVRLERPTPVARPGCRRHKNDPNIASHSRSMCSSGAATSPRRHRRNSILWGTARSGTCWGHGDRCGDCLRGHSQQRSSSPDNLDPRSRHALYPPHEHGRQGHPERHRSVSHRCAARTCW